MPFEPMYRLTAQASPDGGADSWGNFTQSFRNPAAVLPAPWADLFEPLRTGTVDSQVVIAQIGQSLDGRIATESGHSKYINGPSGLAHLHRLRSLVDAVVVGVGTALADDPLLTVRRVTAQGTTCALSPDVEVVTLPAAGGRIDPPAILAALAERGLRRILVEGGADTVSRFLAAGCLDRLHIIVAPIILGSGRASFVLPPVERADQALRAPMRTFRLDDEILFDCDLSAQRLPVGRAKKST